MRTCHRLSAALLVVVLLALALPISGCAQSDDGWYHFLLIDPAQVAQEWRDFINN